MKAMVLEYQSIVKNDTWELVPLPFGLRSISARWIFKLKPSLDGTDALYKGRIVARGNEQIHGVNFQEAFVPMVRWESIHLIIALAASHCWPLFQLDVITAFLNGALSNDVYMLQPPGCIVLGQEHLVCKLKRSLYGLRQSPRAWYARIDIYLQHKGLRRTSANPNVYYYRQGKTITIMVL
jgi:hypothetical protein